MSAVKMSIDSFGQPCQSLVSAVNIGPCVVGSTEFSHSVEEFLLRLRCSPLYINRHQSIGSIREMKIWALIFLNFVISSQNLACRYVASRRQVATLLKTDFWYLSPNDFGAALKFSLPLRPIGPKISNDHKTSGDQPIRLKFWSTCGRH